MSDPYATTAPGLRPRKRRRTGRYVLLGLAIATALAGSVGLAYAMGWGLAGDRTEAAAPATSAATVTAYGQMQLSLGGFAWNRSPEQCWGHKGYDDIREGAPVTITDPNGKVIALGKLLPGKPQVSGDRATGCLLRFEVDGVPAGLKFYGVEVSHRGSVKFPEDELTGKGVTLSLGG